MDLATRRGAAADVRRGHEREPGVRAERPAHRVHVHALRESADFHHRPRRQEPEAGDASRATTISQTGPNDARNRTMRFRHALLLTAALVLLDRHSPWPQRRATRTRRRSCRPAPPPPSGTTDGRRGRRRRRNRSPSRPIVPPEPVRDDAIASASLDDLNRNSPLKPVFFELRQQRSQRGWADDAQRERRAAEEISQLDGDHRRTLRRARDRRVQSGIG